MFMKGIDICFAY